MHKVLGDPLTNRLLQILLKRRNKLVLDIRFDVLPNNFKKHTKTGQDPFLTPDGIFNYLKELVVRFIVDAFDDGLSKAHVHVHKGPHFRIIIFYNMRS
jgi:hypothetical protein